MAAGLAVKLIRRAVGIGPLVFGLFLLPGPFCAATPVFASPSRTASELEDAPAPFRPRRPATDLQADRLEAEALYAAGRMRERRQDYAAALAKYERALRRDPEAVEILTSILQLAFRLNRNAEADRYAAKLALVPDGDLFVLSRVGLRLAEQGQWEAAAKIYEKVLAARSDEKLSPTDFLIRVELGKLYHLLDKDAKAAEHFARVQDALKRPAESGLDQRLRKELLADEAPLYRLIGDCFLGAGRATQAIEAYRKADAAKPNPAVLGFNLARAELRAGHADKALAHLQAYFDQRAAAEGMQPYRVLADALAAQGKSGELAARLEKMTALDQGNVALGYFLADHYRKQGQYDRAEKPLAALVKRAPTTLGYQGLAEIYRKTHRIEPLLQTLGEAVGKTSALESLGDERKAVVGDPVLLGRLIELARKQHQADSRLPDYPVRLAVALLALQAKRFAEAGEFFELAIGARPKQSAELLLEWGVGLLAGERSAEAAKVFERGTQQKVRPEVVAAFYYYWIAALGAADRYDEALAAARKARESKKDSARLAGRAAWVLYLMKRYDESSKEYLALVERFEGDHSSQEVRLAVREARLLLSNIANVRHQSAEAEEWLEKVLDEFPEDPSASNDLAYLWAERGVHLERALRLVRAAIEDEPDNQAYRDTLGWVYYQRKQYPQAVAELQKAAAAKKPDAVILEHLGDAHLKAGQADSAKQAWQRAAKVYRDAKEEDKARAVEKKVTGDRGQGTGKK